MDKIEFDISKLTTFPVVSIQKILSRYQDCICYNLQERLDKINEYVELDIYIGKLIIRQNEDKIEYKFIPSSSFESDIKNTILTGESPLVKKLETVVQDKITSAYKEFF